MMRTIIVSWAVASVVASAAFAQQGMQQPIQQHTQQQGTLVMLQSKADAEPSGWLGISTRQPEDGRRGNAEDDRRPVIVSVTPGSPAQKAGLAAGDTILSYNNVDVVKKPMAIYGMLRPGSRVVVRVRRERVRAIPVIVGMQPKAEQEPLALWFTLQDDVPKNVSPFDLASIDLGGKPGEMGLLLRFGCGETPSVLGAATVPLTRNLAAALRVPNAGVLVTAIAPGTPAMASGLKSGDVIITADSVHVTGISVIAQLMQTKLHATERVVRLGVRRGGAVEQIALRW